MALLDTAGTWRWARRVDTSYPHEVALAADLAGRLHLAGIFQDSLALATEPVATRLRAPDARRLFVAQLGATGHWLTARDVKAADYISPLAWAVGAAGQQYLGGSLGRDASQADSLPAAGPTALVAHGLFRTGYVTQLPLQGSGQQTVLRQASPRWAAVGAWVMLQGTGLASVSQVRVGGITAELQVIYDQRLRVQVPAGAKPGSVRLEVSTPQGHTQLPHQLRIRRP
ncbi:IPT/TIG domain-containing protein [Hymenobacter lapidiphilus]|uniref:IPT/TIG domain-containing protein n=1 Tax=Hymenobacter sp. CCM 8763 TaxID=2303334 RepID=UPI0011C1B2D0|nr:IPT/TIG domain-containing protein [Hymenobacter sp. CCM 8763]